ncbi:MAG: methyltransferase domain-containing protein [Saprospiraceae bacterium]|nr:methyltransferase domain-containing protein [Saprospiraceae bacterium]
MSSSISDAHAVDKGEVELSLCTFCGAICNEGYDPNKVSFQEYDFSNDHSPLFAKYQEELIKELVERHDIRNKVVLEIGSGEGVFLKAICKVGQNRGIGIDPGFDVKDEKKLDCSFIKDFYSPESVNLKPDIVFCRHVLNVISDQKGLLQTLRNNLDDCPETVVYIEVPDAMHTFRNQVFWNVSYEHRFWFIAASLRFLLESCGFEVMDVRNRWHDEFLSIEARPTGKVKGTEGIKDSERRDLLDTCFSFQDAFRVLKDSYDEKINVLRRDSKKVVAWGAGARAVTFFNLCKLNGLIPAVVDINTLRQGKYLPGSAQPIIAPGDIPTYDPDVVVITNPTYADEIMDSVKKMGFNPDFWVL